MGEDDNMKGIRFMLTWITCLVFFSVLAGVLSLEKGDVDNLPLLLITSTGFALYFYFELMKMLDDSGKSDIKKYNTHKMTLDVTESLFLLVPIIAILPNIATSYATMTAVFMILAILSTSITQNKNKRCKK